MSKQAGTKITSEKKSFCFFLEKSFFSFSTEAISEMIGRQLKWSSIELQTQTTLVQSLRNLFISFILFLASSTLDHSATAPLPGIEKLI